MDWGLNFSVQPLIIFFNNYTLTYVSAEFFFFFYFDVFLKVVVFDKKFEYFNYIQTFLIVHFKDPQLFTVTVAKNNFFNTHNYDFFELSTLCFLFKLILCKTWRMHVLLEISLFEHKIPHISYMNNKKRTILVSSRKLFLNNLKTKM